MRTLRTSGSPTVSGTGDGVVARRRARVRKAGPGEPRVAASPYLAVTHGTPSDSDFESAIQLLIANFLQYHRDTPDHERAGLVRVLGSLAHELGRVEGAARLHGIAREDTLDLVREGILSGKHITLAQHGENDCECEASKVLQAEVEPN